MINMFGHVFKHRFKRVIRERTLIFWALIFPCILATLFHLAFGNFAEMYTFNTIRIGVVEKEETPVITFLEELEIEGEEIFAVHHLTKAEAENRLDEGSISSFIVFDEEIELFVNRSGYDQTMVKHILDNYLQASSVIDNLFEVDSQKAQALMTENLDFSKNYVQSDEQGDNNMILVSFYSLIALGAIYGGFFGMKTINESEGNLSGYGIKNVLAPFHKIKILIPSLTVDVLVQATAMILLVSYMRLLGVDFGDQLFYVYLIAVFGGIVGIIIGAVVGITNQLDERKKDSIISAVGFFMAFLSGMVIVNIKHWVQSSAPWLAQINPGNLITDGIYSLYYYDTMNRYWENVIMMVIISVILLVIISIFVRRRQYDSI